MFKCDVCAKVSAPREKQNKVVFETRSTVYYQTEKLLDDEDNETFVQGKELGRGFETVRELALCHNCNNKEKDSVYA